MMRLGSDLLEILNAVVDGKLDEVSPRWDERAAVGVVAASRGYPGSYPTGLEISGVDEASSLEDVCVFHSGTKRYGAALQTAGGRVLTVTALGADMESARSRAYEAISKISFEGMHYRKDIAARIVAR
jgi:phosphoribosylamine--glycine ligase